MKLGLAIGFALLVILLGLAFYKYEKFIPNLAPIHPALSAQEIEEINKTKPVTTIEVFKQQWQLKLKHHDQIIRSYPIRLGFNPMGHKQFEGDGKTPEGTYTIDWRNPQSAYYKSLHISYPNPNDLTYAKQRQKSAGGDVMIHGTVPTPATAFPASSTYMPRKDWTLGCIAVTNADMDEIWQLVKNGTQIIIHP
ncbi:L,D-transpeptidase family protein [Acinetobacter junii]|jgi:murein L,D-transpeptidase YafK|uniref:L,D-transpeptidase family protein n=1 Tax=Acinetobacter junii TaxID=40215 RepID=UPI0009507495|nr:L,D-transpeptidase family protein [Acinetobacter junii]APU49635.1 L,D-transpeptidase catalytic domain protein [Acinetobacter junii]MDA3507074.1 L,D-transpeptidase family protein [Acinetobacter junii]MDA3533502.1 L,D-transpeptidase family protein [Acinetobacter junii]MDH0666489.1 L,D-transpeptidase family protein [Acinetobacter junii]MDH1689264.1 L,D-transpeptidase family protein [Acinetobacter junii]